MPVTQTKRTTVAEMPAAAETIEPVGGGNGQFEDEEQVTTIVTENGTEEQVVLQKAPGPKILGTLPGTSDDGQAESNFNGQVIVPAEGSGGDMPSEVETVSLGTQTETPDMLYERSYESLLRRQFGDAETGFRAFVQKYNDNSLAGNAQYWLGETYYVQGDYRQAAQSFLKGYREYPKSRKAADSLLKLGLSLNRLGQKEQACAAFTQLGGQFPKAAEARKRARPRQSAPAARADRPVAALEAQILFKFLETRRHIALAVSGGGDSTALMWLAARWAKASKIRRGLISLPWIMDFAPLQPRKRDRSWFGRRRSG